MDKMSATVNDTMSTSSTGFFCDLCKLDFSTKEVKYASIFIHCFHLVEDHFSHNLKVVSIITRIVFVGLAIVSILSRVIERI